MLERTDKMYLRRSMEVPYVATQTRETYHGIATDFDGVFSHHADLDIAREMVPLLVDHSIKKNVPLAVITGKELADARKEIMAPIMNLMPNVEPGKVLIYANNGSVIHDAALDHTIKRRAFSHEMMEELIELDTVRLLMEVYEGIQEVRAEIGNVLPETHFRQMDGSTLCFRIEPEKILKSDLPDEVKNKLMAITFPLAPSRFQIAMAVRREAARVVKLAGIQIQSTDRSIDITPSATGKRAALLDFAERTKIGPDKLLRFGDSPTGMDYGLLAAYGNEERPGFTNVDMCNKELGVISNLPEHKDSRPPRAIKFQGNQFEKVRAMLASVEITPAK